MNTDDGNDTRVGEHRPAWAVRIAAAVGFAGVALGAFGAHGLERVVDDARRLEVWDTAVLYHLIHGVMLYLVAVAGRWCRGAWLSFLVGVGIFSGSLYLLALTGQGWLGAITPLGGLALLVGWVWLLARGGRGR